MNGILYVLTGCCIAAAMVVAFFTSAGVERLSETDLVVTVLLLSLFAAGSLFLTCTRWGRKWKMRMDKRSSDEDDRVRTTPGKVRRPLGP